MILEYDDAGAGPPVVLIHGHPFDRSMWAPQVRALAPGFRVIAPDLRGYGASQPDPAVVANVRAMMERNRPEGAAAAMRGRVERPDYRPILKGLQLPAFVCVGDRDTWSTADVTAELLACLRDPAVLVLEGVGHMPNLERPEAFNVALGDFLRACG